MGAVDNSVMLAHLMVATLCCGEFRPGYGLQQSLDRLRRMCRDERSTGVMVPPVIASSLDLFVVQAQVREIR